MDDVGAIVSVCFFGAGAAVIAFVLYFFTSDKEPPGFRLVPRSVGGWGEYFHRTLVLVSILSLASGTHRHIHPGVMTVGVISAVVLLVLGMANWKSAGLLNRIGFVLGALAVLLALLFPSVS